jgi:hypothetical protein
MALTVNSGDALAGAVALLVCVTSSVKVITLIFSLFLIGEGIFLIGGARRCCGGKTESDDHPDHGGGARWQGISTSLPWALLSAATARGAAHAPDERQIRLHAGQ